MSSSAPRGGSDFDLNAMVALCRSCHEQTDAPYDRGKLVVTPLGLGQFAFEVVERGGKGAASGPASLPPWATPRRDGRAEFAHMGNDEGAKA